MNPKIVYHFTSKYDAKKIIKFGFDMHLNAQGSIKRLRESNSPKIKQDKYIKFLEDLPENKVINTCIDPEKMSCGDYLLRIKLKPDTRLLDVDSIDELSKAR